MNRKISNKLILKDVNLIDGNHNYVQKDMVISIRDGKIEYIKKSDEVELSKDSQIISLSGKTVIPGLIDCHVHLLQSGVDDFLKPYAERLITNSTFPLEKWA